MLSFDTVLDNYIKTGIYQVRTFLIIGLIEFCDGIEYVFMSILMNILRNEWNLSKTQVATLGSFYFAGVVMGNFTCAYIADKIGRKTTFSIFCGLSVILVYAISFANSFNEIIIARFLLGIVFGATSPLGFIFITEVSVTKYRGRFSLAMTIMYCLGKIYLVILCFVFLNDYQSGNWRGLIRFNGIPITICFVASLFFLDETIRYYLGLGEYSKAFEEISHVISLNNHTKRIHLSNKEKDALIQWQIRLKKLENQVGTTEKGMLSKNFIIITLLLTFVNIFNNLQNMSIYLLMPFLFQDHNSGFDSMLYLFLIEIIFVFLIYFLIDNPQYGGRVKLLIYCSIILVIVNALLFIFKESFLFLGMLSIKLCTRAIASIIYILTCESYNLSLRSRACGIIQAMGKLASVPAPYIMFPLYYYSAYLPFGFLFIMTIVMTVFSINFPEDRTQKHLEHSEMKSE